MNALWQIILQILWRLRPVQALEVNLNDVIDMGLSMFADDLAFQDLAADAPYRATLAAAFWDAHIKADLLIYLRACEISGVRPRLPRLKPNLEPRSASLIDIWNNFHRLLKKVDDYERLAQRRAERMKREASNPSYGGPLRLDATHRSTSPGFAGGGLRGTSLSLRSRSLRSRKARDGLARRSAAQAAGGGASPRGPPKHPIFLESVTLAPEAPLPRSHPHMRS